MWTKESASLAQHPEPPQCTPQFITYTLLDCYSRMQAKREARDIHGSFELMLSLSKQRPLFSSRVGLWLTLATYDDILLLKISHFLLKKGKGPGGYSGQSSATNRVRSVEGNERSKSLTTHEEAPVRHDQRT
jgi:hypothetical protein